MEDEGQFTVSVPLAPVRDVRLVVFNEQELRRIGVTPPVKGPPDESFEEEIARLFALRPARTDEIHSGAYTCIGLASRYSDGDQTEGVRGDGRVVTIGEVTVADDRGPISGAYDIQIKGIRTGLEPAWMEPFDHGKQGLCLALEEMIYADYLRQNGVRASSWLAIVDLRQWITRPDGGKDRAGLMVRAGNFLRLAHLNQVRDSPSSLRQILDEVNRQISLDAGRNRPMSLAGLYKTLCQRKAVELAATHWLRVVHGSPTWDNIGLLESLDHGTASTVDRTHPGYSFFSDKVGYGEEPTYIMSCYFGSELYDLLLRVATPAEKQALERIDPRKMTRRMLDRCMIHQTLLHAGFQAREARSILTANRRAVRAFCSVVDEVAGATQRASHRMGSSGTTVVERPARYDVFAALTLLAELHVTRRTAAERVRALLPVLRPGQANAADQLMAQRLVRAFDPVISFFLGSCGRWEAVGRVRLMRESARIRNKDPDLVRQDVREYAASIVERIVGDEPLQLIRADLRAYLRKRTMLGPGSALWAASAIQTRTAPRTSDGRLILSSHSENGVLIQEVSNGARDAILIRLDGNPLRLQPLSRYGLRFRLGRHAWKEMSPTIVGGGRVVFEIPLPSRVPSTILVAFFDQYQRDRAQWDNNGYFFGRGVPLVLSSESVRMALGIEAMTRGLARPLRRSLHSVAFVVYRTLRSETYRKSSSAAEGVTQRRTTSWKKRKKQIQQVKEPEVFPIQCRRSNPGSGRTRPTSRAKFPSCLV
ncbi:MAG: protein adenylyltransferase SelO family protein [Thermodesulfobacteriota bacterium]|nr:protein adenylyltransferase SelO family protein [Thermodesulfobacteriota bacterium]